jgi:hypothetical protein
VSVLAAFALLLLSSEPPVAAIGEAANPLVVEAAARAEQLAAIAKGLEYLAAQQSRELGVVGGKYQVAVTSLAGMAFLGAGYGYNRGKYGEQIALCLKYVLESAQSDAYPGFLAKAGEDHPMHGHAFGVLFLTQAYGELPANLQRKAGETIRRGIERFRTARSRLGGWYYGPTNESHQDENSVTVGVLQALRGARNVGFDVDEDMIAGARQYLERCQKADGSFRYQIDPLVTWSTFELTCASVASLQALGVYGSDEVNRGIDFMERQLSKAPSEPLSAATRYRYYGNFYAAQVFYLAGGERWRNWQARAYEQLIEEGRREGWVWKSRFGDEYATAMAVLTLEVPLGYLPIFQR